MREQSHSTKLCEANCSLLQSLDNIKNEATQAAGSQNILYGLWKDEAIKDVLFCLNGGFLSTTCNIFWQQKN